MKIHRYTVGCIRKMFTVLYIHAFDWEVFLQQNFCKVTVLEKIYVGTFATANLLKM